MKGGTGAANYLNSNTFYWVGSPGYFYSNYADGFNVFATNLIDSNVDNTYGSRSAVSLKHGMKIKSGNGSSAKPYEIR